MRDNEWGQSIMQQRTVVKSSQINSDTEKSTRLACTTLQTITSRPVHMSAPIHDSTTLLPTHLRIDTHAYELDVEVWEKCKDPVRDGKERRGKVIVGKSIAGD